MIYLVSHSGDICVHHDAWETLADAEWQAEELARRDWKLSKGSSDNTQHIFEWLMDGDGINRLHALRNGFRIETSYSVEPITMHPALVPRSLSSAEAATLREQWEQLHRGLERSPMTTTTVR